MFHLTKGPQRDLLPKNTMISEMPPHIMTRFCTIQQILPQWKRIAHDPALVNQIVARWKRIVAHPTLNQDFMAQWKRIVARLLIFSNVFKRQNG